MEEYLNGITYSSLLLRYQMNVCMVNILTWMITFYLELDVSASSQTVSTRLNPILS
jgi:hypothetical protein